MPWQLIYTSAPRGLLSGQSGFCTVAHSGDLREALAQRLEQLSSYHYLRVAEAATANRNPTVCAFRNLDLRGTKYHVLTRIQPCGLDFTARTNHLAHHLVFQPNELAQLPSPAAILRHWNGWLSSWQGEPRLLDDPSIDSFSAAAKTCLPAQTWLRVTGDAGRAAGLLESEYVRGCYLVCPSGGEQQVLEMFCETLQLLNLNGQYALRPWRHSFTTFLQAEDNPADFQWRACQEGTPAYQQAVQRSAVIQLRSVRVPANSLVKTAREGQKPPAPPSTAAAPQTKLSIQQSTGRRPSTSVTDTSHWHKPVERSTKPDFLNLNFSINSASLARIGVFLAVLLILCAVKYSHSKKHAPPPTAQQTAPAQIEPAKPPPHPVQTAPLDLTQLNCLSDDGPTYIYVTINLESFILPINSISRFQNLINRFDNLEARPDDIKLSLNTDGWDFPSGTALTVNGRQTQALSARTAAGLEYSFDYSFWKNDPNNPIAVQVNFPAPSNAFSIHFGFSSTSNGDPFRLLIVKESDPPVPLRLSIQWLKANSSSLAGSFQPALGERLLGHFTLLNGRRWQLQPFVHTDKTRYLYQDWPAEDLPPLGDELDFAVIKARLAARQKPLAVKLIGLTQKLDQQIKQAGLDAPLGKDLALTNARLASFAAFSAKPDPGEFIVYLNTLKKRSAIKGWPRLAEDDDESDLASKFQHIHELYIAKIPEARTKLTVGNTNYFAAVWQSLKDIDKTRQEKQRLQDVVDKLQGRLNVVPEELDKLACVSLFIIDPPQPELEMIRFEGPKSN